MSDERKLPLDVLFAKKRIEYDELYIADAKAIVASYEGLPASVKAELELPPNLDLHQLEHDAAWRSWKKDDKGMCTFPVEEGRAGWIRIKNAGNTVLALVKAMKKQSLTKVSLGLLEYRLSGEDFLQRRPLKKTEENDPHAKMEKNIENVKRAGEKLSQ